MVAVHEDCPEGQHFNAPTKCSTCPTGQCMVSTASWNRCECPTYFLGSSFAQSHCEASFGERYPHSMGREDRFRRSCGKDGDSLHCCEMTEQALQNLIVRHSDCPKGQYFAARTKCSTCPAGQCMVSTSSESQCQCPNYFLASGFAQRDCRESFGKRYPGSRGRENHFRRGCGTATAPSRDDSDSAAAPEADGGASGVDGGGNSSSTASRGKGGDEDNETSSAGISNSSGNPTGGESGAKKIYSKNNDVEALICAVIGFIGVTVAAAIQLHLMKEKKIPHLTGAESGSKKIGPRKAGCFQWKKCSVFFGGIAAIAAVATVIVSIVKKDKILLVLNGKTEPVQNYIDLDAHD